MKNHQCNSCDKTFSTPTSLRCHSASFHDQQHVKFQCWNCPDTYAGKESVLTHSRKIHNDHNFVIVRTSISLKYSFRTPGPHNPNPAPGPIEQHTRYEFNLDNQLHQDQATRTGLGTVNPDSTLPTLSFTISHQHMN